MPHTDPSLGNNPATYSALLTTTLQNFQPQMVDNFSDATPFIWWMTQNERKRHLSGGTSIEVPLMYGGASVQAFSGYQNLETEPVEGIAPATFLWRKYQVPIVIAQEHMKKNMGEERVLSLVEAKVRQAEIAFRETLNFDLLNNGKTGDAADTSAVPDPKRVTGLTDICQNSSQARQYGGIDASTNTWWANTVNQVSTNFATDGIDSMRTAYLTASRGNDAPDLILTSQSGFENYDKALVSDKRFVNTLAADAGFTSLMYMATTILFDRDCVDEFMFMLNTNYLTLYVHSEVDMASTAFRDAENQWAQFSRIFWMGELTCSNRKRQALVIDVNV